MNNFKLTEQHFVVVLCALQHHADYCLEQYLKSHDEYWEAAYLEDRQVFRNLLYQSMPDEQAQA